MKVTFKIISDLLVIKLKEEEKEQILKEIEQAKIDCENYIEAANRVKNAYFWTSAKNSEGRRAQEEKYSFLAEQDATLFRYFFKVNVSVSANYFYVHKYTIINNKEFNLIRVKTFLKDLENLELYLTQEDIEVNLSKKSKALLVSEEALKETECLIFTELLKYFDYKTLKEREETIKDFIVDKTIEILLKLNKRQTTTKKATEIQNSFEFFEELKEDLIIYFQEVAA